MKRSIKSRLALFVFAAIVLCAALYLAFGETLFSPAQNREPYSSFYSQVESGAVHSVSIEEDVLRYVKKSGDEVFVTENPQSPLLKEFLLRNDVEVSVQKSGMEIFTVVMDLLFYGIFFVIFFMAFRKFISPNTFKVFKKTGKTFSNVVGMEKLKADMRQVMDIMQHPREYAARGIRMPKGILLEGAPGNGKTLFAKALAGEAKVSFIPAKATDFESMFMALGPMKVKLLFRKARRHAPCIVFIDEFDGIGTRRNYTGSAIETENTRIVTALLNELDGFEASEGVLVLAATNCISALDEALIRPGRFDARVSVPYPNEADRMKLIQMYTQGMNFEPDCTAEKLCAEFNGFSCAKIESVLNRARLIAVQDERSLVDYSIIKAAMTEQESAR